MSIMRFKYILKTKSTLFKRSYFYELIHFRGMTVTSGTVTIRKDTNNLIGISIGGGAPLCPCLYIVQIFDNTAASRDGTLQSGDELIAVNGQPVKGKTKVEVAKMIQATKVWTCNIQKKYLIHIVILVFTNTTSIFYVFYIR